MWILFINRPAIVGNNRKTNDQLLNNIGQHSLTFGKIVGGWSGFGVHVGVDRNSILSNAFWLS